VPLKLETILRQQRRLRIIGIDDGPFLRGRTREVLVVGTIYSSAFFEGLLTTRIRQDGHNATTRLIHMIANSKFHAQLHLLMLDGITLGGFNVVDLPYLSQSLNLPCIAIMRHRPDQEAITQALLQVSDGENRKKVMDRAGPIYKAGPIFFQVAGVDVDIARQAITGSAIHGYIPECLRSAHLIAAGLIKGQSGRRA
jgi:hypothetical protein